MLAAERKAAGMTQMQVAAQLQRPQSFVADIENAQRRVDVVELLNIADVIGFDAAAVVQRLSKLD